MKLAYVVLVGLIMLAYGCLSTGVQNPKPGNGTTGSGTGDNGTFGGITKEMCDAARGHWNECGSACRGAPPDTPCVMMCVQYCECSSSAKCPQGYACGDFVKGTGVCKVPVAKG